VRDDDQGPPATRRSLDMWRLAPRHSRCCSSGIRELGRLRTSNRGSESAAREREAPSCSELISAESLPQSAHSKTAEEAPDSQRMLLHAVLASQHLDDARLAEDAGGDTEDMATDAGRRHNRCWTGGGETASRRHCSSGIRELGKLRTEEKDRCRLLNARQTIGSELILPRVCRGVPIAKPLKRHPTLNECCSSGKPSTR